MTVEYLVAGVLLIVGGLVQRRLHRGLPEEARGEGIAGRWSGMLGLVAIVFGVVMLVAGVVSGG